MVQTLICAPGQGIKNMKKRTRARRLALAALVFLVTARPGMAAEVNQAGPPPDAAKIKNIKAYGIDVTVQNKASASRTIG